MGLTVAVGVSPADAGEVEVLAHLVDETDLLPGEPAARTRQRPQMHPQVVGARRLKTTRQFGEQLLGLLGQHRRVGHRLVLDQPAQRRVTGEGVDITRLDPVEAQTEQQVFTDQGSGLHTRSG